MLPTINGKSFLECAEEDFKEIVNNSVYRENEFIDYKEFFSIDKYPKGPERDKAIAEFRSDVCSFANTNGGFLLFGIHEDNGVPSNICGIEIKDDNPDRFELRLKDYLQAIQPRVPNCQFHFIKLASGKSLVIIFIKHDAFAPYIHLENDKDYRIYKRMGNSKTTIAYADLKNMFVQSVALEKEICNYRCERINYYRSTYKNSFISNFPFFLIHIIPETFLDSSYNQNLFVIEKKRKARFSDIFYKAGSGVDYLPTVDGLFFPSFYTESKSRLNNNGVAEIYDTLHDSITPIEDNKEFLDTHKIFSIIEDVIPRYFEKVIPFFSANSYYLCCSIVNCEHMYTEQKSGNWIKSKVDRNQLICQPVMIEKTLDDSIIELAIKRLKVSIALSLGIKHSTMLSNLIDELYPNE